MKLAASQCARPRFCRTARSTKATALSPAKTNATTSEYQTPIAATIDAMSSLCIGDTSRPGGGGYRSSSTSAKNTSPLYGLSVALCQMNGSDSASTAATNAAPV